MTPIVRNIYTGHAAFVIREVGGVDNDRLLLADLDALRDNYRRNLFGILQTRNDAPVPYLVGTILRVSGCFERITAPGRPVIQYLAITELTLTRGSGLYGPYLRIEVHGPQQLLQHFQNAASGDLALPAAAPPDNN